MARLIPLLLGFAALFVTPAVGQVTSTISGGLAIPTGDFAKGGGQDAGLATTGLVLGLDLDVPIGGLSGLSWSSAVNVTALAAEDGFITELVDGASEVDVGRYLASMLFTGIRYSMSAGPALKLHGTGQVGFGLVRAPNATASAMGESVELVSFWEPAGGLSAGAGVTVNDRLVIDATYTTMIDPQIAALLRYDIMSEKLEVDQPMSWVRISIGLRLSRRE